jgi:hypothetical protein
MHRTADISRRVGITSRLRPPSGLAVRPHKERQRGGHPLSPRAQKWPPDARAPDGTLYFGAARDHTTMFTVKQRPHLQLLARRQHRPSFQSPFLSSFDFKIIRAPWRISKCSFGQMKSAFSKAAWQISKLLDRTITSSCGPTIFTILNDSSMREMRTYREQQVNGLSPFLLAGWVLSLIPGELS